jgi:hypothetical protein
MGAMSTMRELAALWPELTGEERLDYRVRFGDDVLEIISIEMDVAEDQATVRGYQLNGPIAQEQRDSNSRAARVKAYPSRLSIEILDRDEPVETDDDPGPPPTLRLAEYAGEDADPAPWPAEKFNNPVADLSLHQATPSVDGSTVVPSTHPSVENWAGDPQYAPPAPQARSSVLDTPVDTWASTAVRLPHDILDRGQKEARRRGISRNILFAHLLDQGLSGLEGKPLV